MPDIIHVQRVTAEKLRRVADGQPWAFPVEVGGKVVGVRVEVVQEAKRGEPRALATARKAEE